MNPLRPVQLLFPDRSARWVADYCRAGKLKGAVKIGKTWMISETDTAQLTTEPERPRVPTVEEAMADLRRRGVR